MANRYRYDEDVEVYSDVISTTEFSDPINRGPQLDHSYYKMCSDVVVPNFHARKARGDIMNNPCTMEFSGVDSSGSGDYTSDNGTYWQTSTGNVTQYKMNQGAIVETDIEINLDDLTREAKLRALSNVDNTPYGFAEDAAEIRETIKFLKRPWGSLADLVKQFSKEKIRYRSKFKSAKGIAKATADVWTSYRFAASPLVRSAHDLVEVATLNRAVQRYDRRTARGFSSEVAESDITSHTSTLRCDMRTVAKREVGVHASILYTVKNPITDWRSVYGLRFKDIPETLWAILPYSFMVDRVVNISDVVRALTNLADPKIRILAASVRVQNNRSSDYTLTGFVRSGWTYTTNGNTVRHFTDNYQRSVWHPTVGDALSPRITPGKLIADATSIADAGALILQRLL